MPFSFKYSESFHIPSYIHPSLEVKEVIYGKTIVAKKFISKGTTLAIFNGQRISSEQAQLITASEEEDSNYITQIGENVWLLPLKREKADYFNHSCEPNSGFSHKRKLADTLVAMRDIQSGEQVTYHYAFSDADASYEFACQCQAPSCTGRFSTKINENYEFQYKYWNYLAPFLRARIIEQYEATCIKRLKASIDAAGFYHGRSCGIPPTKPLLS